MAPESPEPPQENDGGGTSIFPEVILAARGGQAMTIGIHGMTVQADLTLSEWKGLMAALKAAKDRYILVLADLIKYGREKFGDDAVREHLSQLELAVEDEQKALAIGQLTLDFRESHGLTTEHYYVLARSFENDPMQRETWARTAAQENLTANELRHSIERGAVIRQEEINRISGHGSGHTTIQSVLFGLRRWEKKVGGTEAILTWKPEQKRQILDELKPVLELAEKIRETL